MNKDTAWYGSRPLPRLHCTRRGPSSYKRGTAAPVFEDHVYYGYGRPSQLLLSSCLFTYGHIKFGVSSNIQHNYELWHMHTVITCAPHDLHLGLVV